MKKIYSLFAVVAFSTVALAQGAENFDSRSTTSGTGYTTATFSGDAGTTWDLADGRMVAAGNADITISGVTTLIRQGAGGQTITFPNGVGTLNFQYRKGFTSGTTRTIQVYVDGAMVNETPGFGTGTGSQPTVYDYSYAINSSASVVVRVAATGAQVSIDNFSWTAPGSLAVADFKKVNPNFIKNTLVKNEIVFGSDVKDLKVYTLSGAIVKTGDVKNGSTLNVAELAKGNYIVTGIVNNEPVSQKILKD
ncbi:T9SS type A sorting domain-containing protein [Chryseobacterium foetidum]|uniref:T9SS type A sorting domain-containing protein n=1 Tax=Chryseobacterium foetidum TaxID=2951057 RepID=UPI0021CA8714|nr:T9SS type A sorting domain-containing protein [Chryseobacterium foetidum]